MKAISLFIMDVSRSTAEDNWESLAAYLQNWEQTIANWCQDQLPAKVSHRRGDEILFIGEHYFSAYTIAHYLTLHWAFPEQIPYFGIACGRISESIETLDVEIWNHPLIKQAREQNETIKMDKRRNPTIRFAGSPKTDLSLSQAHLLNLLVENQQVLRDEQSDHQSLICSLSSIFQERKAIAELLNKSPSTVSIQYRRGHSDLYYRNMRQIQQLLSAYEAQGTVNDASLQPLMFCFNQSYKSYMKKSMNHFYPAIKEQQ